MNQPDEIRIASLELRSRIGVTAAERRKAQRLTVSLTMIPAGGFDGLDDDLSRTIDYSAVAKSIRKLALARPRKLIETLAGEIAELVLAGFACRQVALELRKYVLKDTEHVAVRLRRTKFRPSPRHS